MRQKDVDGMVAPVAVTLQPLVLQKHSFAHICDIMPLWNAVIDRVARDKKFLVEAIAPIAETDETFTAKQLEIYKRLYCDEKVPMQSTMLGILRSDYMRDKFYQPPPQTDAGEAVGEIKSAEWKHIEINTIAASFGALSTKAGQLQEFLARVRHAAPYRPPDADLPSPTAAANAIAVSQSLQEIPAGLAKAHQWFVENELPKEYQASDCVVCTVVQEKERNTGDQYMLAFALEENHGIHTIRRSLQRMVKELELVSRGPNKPPLALFDNGSGRKMVVSVFYFRAAYGPQDFPSEDCWTAREKLESTAAIKCPSMPYHLCTTKQIQQLLSKDEILSKFVPDKKERVQLQSSFVGQYPVGEYRDTIIPKAIANPDMYVLKCQLEGGGNLIAGEDMVKMLQVTKEQDPKLWNRVQHEYLVMEKIVSATHSGFIFRKGAAEYFDELVPELGTFGVILSSEISEGAVPQQQLLHNVYAGYLMRTKPSNVADGGVMTGLAALDVIAVE